MARNTSASGALLTTLAGDSDAPVRVLVALAPHCPQVTLTTLAGDEVANVRWAVAGNLRTPVATLKGLATDPQLDVRRAVARNPRTPAALRRRLMGGVDNVRRHLVLADIQAPCTGWEEVVAVHGRAVEEAAWAVVCSGFTGELDDLVLMAMGVLVA